MKCKFYIFSYYGKVTPSSKKILQLLKSNPKEDLEKGTVMYSKQYVKRLRLNLRKLFQFLTGSDVVAVEKIDIAYYKPDSEFCRRPISHTCWSCFELPTTYNNFCELRAEFNQVLQKKHKNIVGIWYCVIVWLLVQSSLLTLTT